MRRVIAVLAIAVTAAAVPAAAQGRLKLAATPDQAEAGKATLFKLKATRGSRPARGVTVRFAGQRAKTNRRGRAAIRATLPRAGRYVARVGRATATVTATEAPEPAPQESGAPERFSGECAIDGIVRFDPPMTNTPQRITQSIDGQAALCTGTFVDAAGRTHELDRAPVSETTTAVSENHSCGAAFPSGPGILFFPHGAIDVTFDEYRIGALPLVRFTGAAGGSLTGYASPTEEPAELIAKCGAEGIEQVHVTGEMQGEISG